MVGMRLKCSEVKCNAVIVIVGLAWKGGVPLSQCARPQREDLTPEANPETLRLSHFLTFPEAMSYFSIR